MISSQQSHNSRLRVQRSGITGAFSLLEVALAVGIIAFALLAVVALLPTGLHMNKSAIEQARAARLMNALALCIQSASTMSTTAPYSYKALPPFDGKLSWTVSTPVGSSPSAGGTLTSVDILLDDNDLPTSVKPAKQLAHVELTAPGDTASPGKAYIAVTWDQGIINAGWSAATSQNQLASQRNYVETFIYFRAR